MRRCLRVGCSIRRSHEVRDHLIRLHLGMLLTWRIISIRIRHKDRRWWSERCRKKRFRRTTAILRGMKWSLILEMGWGRRISRREEISRTWVLSRNSWKRKRRIADGRSQCHLEKYQRFLMYLTNRRTRLQILSKRWKEGSSKKEEAVGSRMWMRRIGW